MAYQFQDSIQRGLLYLAKSEENFLVQVMPMVKADYFEFPSHQKFYSIIKDHYQAYRALPSDDQILEEAKGLKSDNELLADFRDELDALNSVDEKSIQNEEYYLDLVEEFAKEQALKDAIINSLDLLKSKKFGEIEAEFRTALTISRDVDLGSDYFTGIEERWNRINSSSLDVQYRTPFGTVNEQLEGGLCSKELAMVVAPPGVGKSLFLANQGARSVLDGKNVLYISLEMAEDRVAQRFDSIFTRIRQKELAGKVGTLKERLEEISDAVDGRGKLKIKEFPTKRLTIAALRAYLNQLQNYEDFVPDVLIIDYLELLTTDAQLAEYSAQERLAQELRGIAVESNLLVWTATQTNREGRKVNIITDAELADSYGKIRVCDLVFSINQSEQEFDESKARLYIMKSRNGKARFIVPVRINYSTLVISQENGI
jgi:replicative DNA helicase